MIQLDFEQEALFFKMVGDPIRLQILHLLSQHRLCVKEIEQEVRVKQSDLSYHLGLLYNAGLLSREKRDQRIFYQINLEMLTRMIALLESLCS